MFSQVKGQEDNRRPETFRDKHGREYFANVEKSTGMPCEVLQPRFKAPLNPDWAMKMLLPPVDDRDVVKMVSPLLRGRKGYDIEIDYDAWLAKHDRRLDAWTQKLYEGAKAMAKGRDSDTIANNPPPILLSELGAPPLPPRVFIEAMKAGNKWALGQDEKVPAKAMALLEEVKGWVVKRRRIQLGNAIADPLADDEQENVVDQAGFEAVTDLDPFGDIEEQHDPQATGGKKVQPRKRGPRKAKTELEPAA